MKESRELRMHAMQLLNINQVIIDQVIAAEGEQKASHALKEAADTMKGSPQALQVSKAHKRTFKNLIKTSGPLNGRL